MAENELISPIHIDFISISFFCIECIVVNVAKSHFVDLTAACLGCIRSCCSNIASISFSSFHFSSNVYLANPISSW